MRTLIGPRNSAVFVHHRHEGLSQHALLIDMILTTPQGLASGPVMSTRDNGPVGVLDRRGVSKLGHDVVGFALSRVGHSPIHSERALRNPTSDINARDLSNKKENIVRWR